MRSAGGREDEWRRSLPLPERLRLLDKAAGLDHREIKARSLHLAGARRGKIGRVAPVDKDGHG